MNWLEKSIATLAPQFALSRARARMALDVVAKRGEKFSYDAARAGRRTDGWIAGNGDANVELMWALRWLRDRSRDLIRNNPHAVKAVEELVGNAIGTGIVPRAKTGNRDIDKIIDAEWPYFVEQCDTPQRLDFYGMQAITMRTTAESGEGIVRFRPRFPQDGLRVPLQLQLLESDFLDEARTMGTLNGHVMQGVQFDMLGRRVAYWLFTYHPGGVLIMNPRGGIISQPVPAEQVLHLYRLLRPGQVRGVPWLTPVMMALRDLDDYADAERVRKKIEACVVAIVTQPESQPTLGITKNDPITNRPIENFAPGMVDYLTPGQDVKFNNPAPTGGYREYNTTELQRVASGIGIPYEILASDMSLVNYSSFRGGQLGFRNTIECYRWLTHTPQFSMPVRRRFIDTLVLLGKIPAKAVVDDSINIYATTWTAPKWESVDPVKDAQAELARMRSGTQTLFDAIASNGFDPQDQLEEIANIYKALDELGIILDCDLRFVNDRGIQQPVGDTAPAPASKPKAAAPKSKIAPKQKAEAVKALIDQRIDALSLAAQQRRWDSPSRTYLT